MRTVDHDGDRYLLVKRSDESSLVRDPETGEERHLPNEESPSGFGNPAGREDQRRLAGRGQLLVGQVPLLAGLGVPDEAGLVGLLEEQIAVAVVVDGPHAAFPSPERRPRLNT